MKNKIKRIILFISIFTLFTGVVLAATYTIKQSGGTTTIKPVKTNLYNNYGANQYVQNNAVNNNPTAIVELVMDYSGSMSDVVMVAENTMANVISQIPASTKIGLRVFGHYENSKVVQAADVKSVKKTVDSSGRTVYKLETGKHESSSMGCSATKLVTPINTANTTALLNGMHSVSIGGSTPMVLALEKAAYSDLSNFSRNIPKKIILITDGGENCNGDPCAFAKTLMSTRRDISVDVVLVSSSSKALYCLANVTGGKVYNLGNIYQFENAVTNSINNAPTTNIPNNNTQNNNQQNYEYLEE